MHRRGVVENIKQNKPQNENKHSYPWTTWIRFDDMMVEVPSTRTRVVSREKHVDRVNDDFTELSILLKTRGGLSLVDERL